MNRVALITGASAGIGLALAGELAKRGYRVALSARRGDVLEEKVALLRKQGYEAIGIPCDVTDSVAVRGMADRVRDQWGGIDLAVANAGIGMPTPAARFVLDDAERVMRTNFFGTLYLFDAVIPAMLARRSGRFVGIASLAGLRGIPGASIYSASKAAMQAFLEASRIELAGRGVGVTVVNPGFIETDMTAQNRFPMPFIMPVSRAAQIIARGLDKEKRQIEFPAPMSLLMRATRLMPAALFDAMYGRFGKKAKLKG